MALGFKGSRKIADFVGRGDATERGLLWDTLSRSKRSEVCADESRSPVTRRHDGGFFYCRENPGEMEAYMAFFTSAIDTLQTLVVALGAGLGVWGVVNLLEGYGSDNPGAKSQGMKQLMAGGGIILLGTTLIPVLSTLF